MNYLVSFADTRMKKSLSRILIQAKKIDFFDKLFLLNENDISEEFRARFKNKLILGSKGYGYWCWKPEIVLSVLDKIQEGDCLLYIDAGCHLNSRGKKRLKEYFNIVKNNEKGVIAFQANEPNQKNSTLIHDGRKLRNLKNYKWIKGDIFDYFGMRENNKIINSQEIAGGVFLIKKCKFSISLIQNWKKIIVENFELIDDSPSISENLPGFVENRHDQAIWTLLCLKNSIKTLSSYEFWYPKNNTKKTESDWDYLKEFPIHAKRDKNFGIKRNIEKIIYKKLYQIKNILSKIGLIKKPIKNYSN